jgi:hypothetical protein
LQVNGLERKVGTSQYLQQSKYQRAMKVMMMHLVSNIFDLFSCMTKQTLNPKSGSCQDGLLTTSFL